MPSYKDSHLRKIRSKAEKMVEKRPLALPDEKPEEYRKLIHELHVHQIELEIQNEELRATQATLQKAWNKYANLFNTAPVGYLILDQSGFVLETNQTFADMVGKDASNIVKRPFNELLHGSSRKIFLGRYKSFFKKPVAKSMELALKTKRDTALIIRVYGARQAGSCAAMAGKRERNCIRLVVIDVTAKWAAEKALAESYAELELRNRMGMIMLKSSDEGMFSDVLKVILDYFQSEFGYFGYINGEGDLVCPSMTRDVFPDCEVPDKSIVFPRSCWGGMWGKSLLTQKSICKNTGLSLPEGHIHLSNALAVPIIIQNELIGQIVIGNKQGDYVAKDQAKLESIANWIAPVLSARIERDRQQAKRQKAENDLRQAQRMESIGVLAGGVAHDFNNILSPIIGYTEIVLDEIPPENRHHRYLTEVSRAAFRARDLVGQLLAFSRKQMLEVKNVDINSAIKHVSGMIKRLIREDITVEYILSPQAGFIKGDSGQIDQIMINLAVNAQDAMPGGGRLTVETAAATYHQPNNEHGNMVEPGDYIRIAVTDTGSGIPEDVLPFIFEPFFTTKDVGRGTGMGLATCYGIVKQHGGHIWVESDMGRGTQFTILLPSFPAQDPDAAEISPDSRAELIAGSGELIMVVEDEPGLRKMASLALKRGGYQVVEPDSPAEGMELVFSGQFQPDLLLSDVVMPGWNGKELYQRLKQKHPRLKVIFMSGYTDNIIQNRGVLHEGIHFIGKPFSVHDLLHKVRSVLDAPS